MNNVIEFNDYRSDNYTADTLRIVLSIFDDIELLELKSIIHSEDFMNEPSESNLRLVNIIVKKMLGFEGVSDLKGNTIDNDPLSFKQVIIDSDDLMFDIIENLLE